MTSGPPSRVARSGNGVVAGLRTIGAVVGVVLVLGVAAVRMAWGQQVLFGGAAVMSALVASRISRARYLTLALTVLSCAMSLRYGLWRMLSVGQYVREGRAFHHGIFAVLLLLAELYAIARLILGYLQMAWPLGRSPAPLLEPIERWPAIDLLIPTLNEPLAVVKYTALAAMNLDWPPDRLHVHVLDDGHREEFRIFCAEAGITYVTRADREGAKAGNLNRALEHLSAPFFAVFDADHVPVRSFLQMTMGWFERDPMLAVLQTPHHLYSADPFERNLRQHRGAPQEGELFHAVVQDGSDLWNAALFTGTGAVLRRSALDSVGGFAQETIAEDVHTSLRFQQKGWDTAYINLPLAAGLATGSLDSYLRQRMRWARGMLHVLRLQNPLFARGLSLAQRFCYFNAIAHFLFVFPRILFLLAPLLYLGFGRVMLPGSWVAILAYGVPHLALGVLASGRLHGPHRLAFWSEVYETVAAPFLLLPALLAFVSPGSGRFRVTPKDEVVDRVFFDVRAAWPLVLLFCLNVAGLVCAVVRTMGIPHWPIHGGLWRLGPHISMGNASLPPGALWINVAWSVFNLVLLSVAIGVAREDRQRRRAVRLPASVPVGVVLPDGRTVHGATADVSSGGVLVHCERQVEAHAGDLISLVLPVQQQRASLPAMIVSVDRHTVRAQFDPLTLQEEELLALLMYAPADTWIRQAKPDRLDGAVTSLVRIVVLAAKGPLRAMEDLLSPAMRRAFLMVLGTLVLLGGFAAALPQMRVRARELPPDARGSVTAARRGTASLQPPVKRQVRFLELAGPAPFLLHAPGPARVLHFDVPLTDVVVQAVLQLRLETPASPTASVLRVLLNGAPAGTVTALNSSGTASDRLLEVVLPPELLVSHDELTLQLATPTGGCPDGGCRVLLRPDSELELTTRPMSPRSDAKASFARAWVGQFLAFLSGVRGVSLRGLQIFARLPLRRPAALLAGVLGMSFALAALLRLSFRERARLRLETK